MAAERIPFLTPEQYLEIERKAEFKSEYVSGQMFMMAGGTPQHSELAFNIQAAIGPQIKGRDCHGHSSDLRVRAGGLFTYPDVTIVCGKSEFHDSRGDTLTNPTVLVEVLSKSTEAYDRGEKFARYKRSASLREYVLVSQRRPQIDVYRRQEDGSWNVVSAEGLDAQIRLESIDCTLRLAEIYEGITLETTDAEAGLPRQLDEAKGT